MNKSIDDYINELIKTSKRSKFKETPVISEEISNVVFGYLLISVSHSQNTFPVSNAEFTVFDKNKNIAANGRTDSSGKSDKIKLPAIPKSLSESPGNELINSAVFYDVEIKAENYIPFTIKNIPVFEGVTTLQNFDMTFFSASPNGLPQTINLPTENSL